jgi:hypothetical protein
MPSEHDQSGVRADCRVTPKLAALAHFAIEHDGLGWSEQMEAWNASRPRSSPYKRRHDIPRYEAIPNVTPAETCLLKREGRDRLSLITPRKRLMAENWAESYGIVKRSNGDADNRH